MTEWILYKIRSTNRNATYKCPACGKKCSSYYNDVGEWEYCPHCGKRMRGDEGKWKFHKDGSGTCSECHTTQKNIWDYDNWQNFCGHCGAKMMKGE